MILFMIFQFMMTCIAAVLQFCLWTVGLLAKGLQCLVALIPGELRKHLEKKKS